MLYDNYEKKILKVANVLSKIVRLLPIIITVLCVIFAAVTGLLIAKGTVGETTVQSEIIYGELPVCEASAFLSHAEFQYRSASGSEWTEETPKLPGEYYVRAFAEGAFGSIKYGDEISFSITPKPVDVWVSTQSVVYGEDPSVSSDTVYSDRVECDGFIYDDIVLKNTAVKPDINSVRFFNEDDEDISAYYKVNVLETEIAINQRDITVTVEDSEKVYDGKQFYYDKYDLTNGTLVEGDTLIATFDRSMVNAGERINQPTLRIITAKGRDVTDHYNIKEVFGKLKIEKRLLLIYTEGCTVVYDGQKVICKEFSVDSKETPLVAGHKVVINTTPDIVNAGKYPNIITFKVLDAEGNDLTENYNIAVGYSDIVVEKRPIVITTESESWVYDSESHRETAFTAENVVPGQVVGGYNWSEITYVGKMENKFNPDVFIEGVGTETTDNYDIYFICGTLEVTKRPVTINTASGSLMYNGMPQSVYEWYIKGGYELAKNDEFIILQATTLTDVGTVTNKIESFSIQNREKKDVSDNYDLTFRYGKLTVYPRPITIVSEYVSKVYDDTPLKAEKILISPNSPNPIVDGHHITADPHGARVDVGITVSSFRNVKVWSGTTEVTKNYEITVEGGIIEIFPRPITIETLSANKYYDGTALTMKSSIVNNLVEGHVFSVTYTGSQTEIGTSPNTIADQTIRITSGERSVTHNYIIEAITEGILEVKPWATISVATNSDEKKYDGMPLTNDGYKVYIIDGELKKGHSLIVKVTGSQTKIGISENTATCYVKDEYGRDVSRYYVIELSMGSLEVYDKKESEIPESFVVALLKPSASGSIYLRQSSYGSYTGSTNWGAAPAYTKLLANGQNYNYLTAVALINSGVSANFAEIKDLCVPYMIPTYAGNEGNYNVPLTDTDYSEYYMPEYSMSYYVLPGNLDDIYSLRGNLGEFSMQELEYRKYVHDVYMDIDAETREYMEKIIAAEDFDINDGSVIFKIASYIQNSAEYNLNYDATLDEQSNVAIAFLESYKEGVCRHYATSATLLYRALGLPARYVTGFLAQNMYANQWNEVTTPGHAWVEVYIDGVGWVQVEVTGGSFGGAGGSGNGPMRLEITPKYQYKVYDGKYLYAENELEMNNELLQLLEMGYNYSVSVEGKQLQVGKGVSKISSFEIYDSFGQNVTGDFEIIYNDGVLEVMANEPIRIYLYEIQKIYDGSPLEFDPDEYEILYIQDGLELELKLKISLTDVGMISLGEINMNIDKYVTYRVLDRGRDVTDSYRMILDVFEGAPATYVPIRITSRTIELSSISESKVYDGKPLSNDTVTITKGALVNGHTLQASAIGSIIGVGEQINFIDTATLQILDAEGNDVTLNYFFVLNEGTLTVVDPDD